MYRLTGCLPFSSGAFTLNNGRIEFIRQRICLYIHIVFVLLNIKMIQVFEILPHRSFEIHPHLPCIATTIAAENLAHCVARASAVLVLTLFYGNIPGIFMFRSQYWQVCPHESSLDVYRKLCHGMNINSRRATSWIWLFRASKVNILPADTMVPYPYFAWFHATKGILGQNTC